MEKIKVSFPTVLLGAGIMLIADQIMMLLGALLIGEGILAFDSASVWGLISLVLAAMIAGVLCIFRSEIRVNTYLSSLVYFFVICLISFLFRNGSLRPGTAVKAFTALLCGAFAGNFFGSFLHNSLRKNGKKKRFYTK